MIVRTRSCRYLWGQNLTHLTDRISRGHFIGGRFDLSGIGSDGCLVASNPSDAVTLGPVASMADAAVACRAARAAKSAAGDWLRESPSERYRGLLRVNAALRESVPLLSSIEALSSGVPLTAARCEIDKAIKQFAAAISSPVASDRPTGVILMVSNDIMPFSQVATHMGRSLCAGSTVVWRPTPSSPLVAQIIAKCFANLRP